MRLTKQQREQVRMLFGGRCAYCGCELGTRWHADHVEPVLRDAVYVRGKGFVPNGKLLCPEHDAMDNLFPSCAPCNIDKHRTALEEWRAQLQRRCEVLASSYSTYRSLLRFGLIVETAAPIVFYFERFQQDGGKA